jgi:hypothetical protein
MKKNLFYCAAILFASALVSCTSDGKDATENYGANLTNLVTPSDGSKSFTSPAQYTFDYNLTDGTVRIGIGSLAINNTSYTFVSDYVSYKQTSYSNGSLVTFSVPSATATSSSTQLTDLTAKITSLYNYNPWTDMYVNFYRQYIVGYNVGDYHVQTFSTDTYYKGETLASYTVNGEHKEYTATDPVYEINMNLSTNKADVYIYNALFASEMKPINEMMLKDLDITYVNGGYEVSGTDLVPYVIEADGQTPNPTYTFNNFTVRTVSKDLTQINIQFTVANRFYAGFNGSAIL